MPYPFSEIEPKWQKFWEENQTFKTPDDFTRKKLYVLDMFPYPSGSGLHVGHPEGYTATDIFCRFKRMNGFNVLHPMGWDAFGLPAERYAMQTGVHPAITTKQNIDNFRRQIKMLGLSYDWSREFSTTDPKYLKWTQWIFLKLYNSWFDAEAQKARPISELEIPAGMSEREKYDFVSSKRLAYLSEMPVNWCEELGTVLANEEVDEWVEKGYKVERRAMRQWMLRITAYAERLEADLSLLNWPNGILEMQRNWVGKSTGAEVDFTLENSKDKLKVYTTRPDTLFGATYMVISPEHPLVNVITTSAQKAAVQEYIQQTAFKSELERTSLDKEKTGVFTGAFAFNPTNGKKIPIWIADYVLITYGTGAIMAVPGHDDRDHEFAVKYKLPIVEVVSGGDVQKAAHTDEGLGINSANPEVSLNGLTSDAAKAKIIRWLEAKKIGQSSVKYKLRDWLFSRQRYWGEPFPLVYREDGTVVDLPEDQLPILLPETESFKPSGTGESVLATVPSFVNTIDPATGKPARRETHTMPQWAGSCWYYLRYIDPHNENEFISPEKEKYWMPIDLYVGGAEHAVLHLLYARFWHKVLFDLGLVSTPEPFARLINQGLILGENGQKMSKSMGNVVNPDDVVKEYGADSLRLFEMFMGPLQDVKPWSTRGVDGVHRFLNRSWRMIMDDETNQVHASVQDVPMTPEQERVFHRTIKKVTEDIDSLNFNTAISQMMIFVNEFLTATPRPRQAMNTFVLLLAPYAPHLAEELWQKLGHTTTLSYEPWPKYDDSKTREDNAEIVVQINGKVRAKFSVGLDASEADIQTAAMADPAVVKWIEGKEIVKVVVVKGKLVNIVVK